MIYRDISVNHTVYQFICFTDTIRYLADNYFLSIKTVQRYLRIGCYDDSVCLFNLFGRQDIFCSAGTSCLYLDCTFLCFGCFFNSFCGHICVRNSCRAGCNCKNLYFSGCLFCCAFFICSCKSLINTCFFFIRIIDNIHELFNCLCIS